MCPFIRYVAAAIDIRTTQFKIVSENTELPLAQDFMLKPRYNNTHLCFIAKYGAFIETLVSPVLGIS